MKPQTSSSIADSDSLEMLQQAAAVVLSMVGIAGNPVLTPLPGGRNNRVFRVDVPEGSLVLKSYFQHPSDPRDRLDAEFSFIKHVWAMGLRCLPQPIARLPLRGLGLYSFIKGQPFQPGQVTQLHVEQAADFVRAINERRHELAGAEASADLIVEDRPVLAEASDACLSLVEHLTSIEKRISSLLTMPAQDDLDRQMIEFVEQQLVPQWRKASAQFRDQVTRCKGDLHEPVPAADRVISPSDFGFHNAILKEDDTAAFLDFEYAGWDDPAKLICDFFTQVAVPVPVTFGAMFTDRFTACLESPAEVKQRVNWLLPLYRIKWCCLSLNIFLPVTADRRAFAQPADDRSQQRRQQLELARRLLAEIEAGSAGVRFADR
jgi:hypothetical protein